MSRPDFDLVWASSRAGGFPVDTITDAQWQQGWLYRAGVPPLTINFDYYQNLNDLRVTWLADQLPVSGVSAFAKTILDDSDAATVRATIGANNADNLTVGTLSVNRLGASGVTAGTYGSSTKIPRVTVDAKGRVTAVTENNFAISSADESTAGLVAEASQAEINAGTPVSKFVRPDKLRYGFSVSSNHISFPTWLGGKEFRWGNVTISSGSTATAATFTNSVSGGVCIPIWAGGDSITQPTMVLSGTSLRFRNQDNNNVTFFYFGIGT